MFEIKKINNYIAENLIKEAYIEIIRYLEAEDFEREEAYEVFCNEFLYNYKNLKKLVLSYKSWYEDFPLDILIKEERDKIIILQIITFLYYKKCKELKIYLEKKGIVFNKEKCTEDDLKIIVKKINGDLEKYAIYFWQELNKNINNNFSIWLVCGKTAYEKELSININNKGKIEILMDHEEISNIKSFKKSCERSLRALRKKYDLSYNIGLEIEIKDIEEKAEIIGNSGTLAIYMAILNSISKNNFNLNSVFISDIDFLNNNLLEVDNSGLKLKIEEAIKNNYNEVFISKSNYSVLKTYEKDIKINSFDNLNQILKLYNIKIKGVYKNNIKRKVIKKYIAIFLFVFIILIIIFNNFKSINNVYVENHKVFAEIRSNYDYDYIIDNDYKIKIPKLEEEKINKIENKIFNEKENMKISITSNKDIYTEFNILEKNNYFIDSDYIYTGDEKLQFRFVLFSTCYIYIFENDKIIYNSEMKLEEEEELIIPKNTWIGINNKDIKNYYIIFSDEKIDFDKYKNNIEGVINNIEIATIKTKDKITYKLENNLILGSEVQFLTGKGIFMKKIIINKLKQ